MNYPLHEYQERMVEFALSHPHCGLFAECGLGKSRTTLNAIVRLIDNLEVEKVLVVCPKKVAENTWTDEVDKWDELNHLRVSRVLGTEKQRIEALNRRADIYVLGRDSFVWLVRYYRAKMPFDMLVIDELTSFKSHDSQRFKAMRLVRSQFDRIIGLTGTPAPNGYGDLFGQIFCLDGGKRLGMSKNKFLEKYFSYYMNANHIKMIITLRPGSKEEIERLISDICISLKAEDYLKLPPISYIPYPVRLSDKLMKDYAKFQREQLMQIADEENITASNAAALMGKLMQFCNGAVYDEERNVHHIHDEKVTALSEIVESAQSPVLIFYQYVHDVERIKSALKGYKVVKYTDGDTLREWNAGKIDVLLAHPANTAYGLNMQDGGHTCIWFGTGWNAELYEQANARLYRQGQKHHVKVYQLYVPGTFDEQAIQAVKGKITLQESLKNAVKQLQHGKD